MKPYLFGLACLLLASPVAANDPEVAVAATAQAQAPACYETRQVIDPALAADQVAPQLAHLRDVAEQGSDEAAYLLGTLYRLGPDHPARRLPRDPVLADRWLRQAALAGHLGAMTGLAENALDQGRAREGLVLALARVHYGSKHPDPKYRTVQSYQAELVRRGFEALGEPRTEALEAAVLDELQVFVNTHGEGIVAGLLASQAAKAPDPTSRCPDPYDFERWPVELRGASSVMLRSARQENLPPHFVLFYIEIKPNGRVAKALPVDFSPGPELLRPMQRAAEGTVFNKLEGAPTRIALLPLSMR